MKADKEKTGTYLMIALSAAGFFLCLIRPQETGKAAAEGIGRCLGVIIPSLYAVMVMSQLFIRSGAADRTAPLFSLAGRLFGMNGDEFAVFVFSSLAGYPVGAKMLCGRAEQGRINSERGKFTLRSLFRSRSLFHTRVYRRTALQKSVDGKSSHAFVCGGKYYSGTCLLANAS